jgi:GTP diphosphokinase / guanosine-3',5'-bis(diphosphate) 3'-diphosphatase
MRSKKRDLGLKPPDKGVELSLVSKKDLASDRQKTVKAEPQESPCVENDPDTAYRLLVKNLETYISKSEIVIIEKAYKFAAHHHRHQTRQSGEPYITHPLEVANILTSIKLDLASITAAILHDTVEDTEATLEDINREFGSGVRDLVDGLTKISKIRFRSSQEKLAENFRKMVMAMSNDLRVILIKLADRLHNMRTLGCMPEQKRIRIAQETLDIYAPLANRLGIYGIKSELEDLALRQTKFDIYREISGKVAAKKAEREAFIIEVKTILESELKKYGFKNLLVYGRPKHFYSIYKKMMERGLEFEDIHDLFAFRIVVDSMKDCYEALGIVHAMWKPMPGRFKDYIAMPKANMYQSLHTTVIRPNGDPAEIQIRTHEMHQTCEYGVAAHWNYKEKNSDDKMSQADLKKFSWLRQIMEWQTELKDPSEFLEAVKVDLFDEEIFVFTPKGDVIQLPAGATALDFAFQVHTEVGLRTVGAKVNGRIVPLKKEINSGDIVEIMTSVNQKPGKDWLNFVTTSKAKNKIRSSLRAEQRQRSRKLGQDILEQAMTKHSLSYEKLLKSSDRDLFVKVAKESNFDDVIVSLGYGRLNPDELLQKVYPKKIAKKSQDELVVAKPGPASNAKRAGGGILVHGIENVLVNFGRCCNPLPGEDVVGFITRGRGVTIHRGTCSRALDMDPHRRVEVQWADEGDKSSGSHIAFLRVTTQDRQGVLADVTQAISACGGNIKKAQIRVNKELSGVLDFELTLNSLSQLLAIVRKIESVSSVVKVERMDTRKMSALLEG